MKWAAINGNFEFSESTVTFRGATAKFRDANGTDQVGLSAGIAISDETFSNGDISARVVFAKVSERNACEIICYYDPLRRYYICAGIGGLNVMYYIGHWEGKWVDHAIAGSRSGLQAGRPYDLKVKVRGSRIDLWVDNVAVLAAVLPFAITPSQAGLWCLDDGNIQISNYRVERQRGRVFIVMQFSSPFVELYDVIKKICDEFQLQAHKADETYGPGIVVSDIARDITAAEFVIAEITAPNPNVYYELGYAHAINKPAILLADRQIQRTPFDIAPFRIMLYDNSIAGRQTFEDGLRRHIEAILKKDAFLTNGGA